MNDINLSQEYFEISKDLKMRNLLWKDIRENRANYFKAIDLFCSVVYDYLVELYDSGVRNFREYNNYDMFYAIYNKERHNGAMKLLFGDHISFEKYINVETSEKFLCDKDADIIFDRYCYEAVSTIQKRINLLTDKRELNPQKMANNLMAAIIDEQRLKRKIEQQKSEKDILHNKQDTFEIIESCVCWIGNKSKKEILDMYVWEVREGFNRIQVHEHYMLAMGGYYAGTISLTQGDKDKLGWTRSLFD